jgi:hypothetical protein
MGTNIEINYWFIHFDDRKLCSHTSFFGLKKRLTVFFSQLRDENN